MKRVLSSWPDYCPPSSTCCRRACSGYTPPCSAGSARTSWGWGLCLVLGFYQMGVLPNSFWPGILTRYIWFWDLNQMEDWPSYSTAWWLSEDGGKPWGLSSRFIESIGVEHERWPSGPDCMSMLVAYMMMMMMMLTTMRWCRFSKGNSRVDDMEGKKHLWLVYQFLVPVYVHIPYM